MVQLLQQVSPAEVQADLLDDLTGSLGDLRTASNRGHLLDAVCEATYACCLAESLPTLTVCGARRAGATWWQIGAELGVHPQTAYMRFQMDDRTPAAERPDMAVVLTAGLADLHNQDNSYGVDLDDLDFSSLHEDPRVVEIRDAARVLDLGVWITVTAPVSEVRAPAAMNVFDRWTSVVAESVEMELLNKYLTASAEVGHG